MEKLQNELEQVLTQTKIRREEPMARHTTFRVGGPADLFLAPTEAELVKVMEILGRYQVPVTIIGNGSNLLAGDLGIRGVVIEIGAEMSDISVDGECILAEGGALLSKVACAAYENGLSGMEFAAGIPGSVGGAIVMNAGAYGGEIKDIVTSVKVLNQNGTVQDLTAEEMEFSYRHSCIEERGSIVLSASFCLHRQDPEKIICEMEKLKKLRTSRQPLEYPSAGSTFKRPKGNFAGKLIMEAGLSGFRIGGAMVSEKHCGFVINKNQASAAEILAVIRYVQKEVKEQFLVELETEVKILGEF